jgi:alpha-beta hydrolase superfamily lysophospholipase
MVGGFRSGADHAKDLAAVIADVRRRVPRKPVWLVGTSRGSISAANVAARLQGEQGPDGVVLTSSVTRNAMAGPSASRDAVFDVDLDAIRVPALVVSHRGDACDYSSPAEQPRIVSKMSNAPRKELLMFQGGDPPRGDPCEPYAAHGFIGIEDEVVGAIADWILKPKS